MTKNISQILKGLVLAAFCGVLANSSNFLDLADHKGPPGEDRTVNGPKNIRLA